MVAGADLGADPSSTSLNVRWGRCHEAGRTVMGEYGASGSSAGGGGGEKAANGAGRARLILPGPEGRRATAAIPGPGTERRTGGVCVGDLGGGVTLASASSRSGAGLRLIMLARFGETGGEAPVLGHTAELRLLAELGGLGESSSRS